MAKKRVLLVYTGGTIGMVKDHATGRLHPVDFNNLLTEIPALKKFNCKIDALFFKDPIDSSDANQDVWLKLLEVVEKNYSKYDGFVILHGTDTMAYSASALSFMIENLKKPIVFTGSQLPLEMIRTDGKENLITAIEIASAEKPVPEVCIYFEYVLMRGNRTTKFSAEHFDAFVSPNYPVLASAGVHIEFNRPAIHKKNRKKTVFHTSLSDEIGLLRIFPGMREDHAASILNNPNNKGVILESFGSGNIPSVPWFKALLKKSISSGIIVLNITQCIAGSVQQGMYENSAALNELGVVSGNDITLEAAITKMMFLLGTEKNSRTIKSKLKKPLAGEMDS
ncbi:MAG: asparaginase [Flavobacteriales bacterium]|nr:asparaginase [Flavobacteriales bacterium]